MPKPDASLSAVVVSGGKQYRVAPGDQILVDRMAAEPGSTVKLGRVLLLHDGDTITVGAPGVEGIEVEAKVLAHRRGPRIETLRYKSKKRQRVHRGGRADLTALEILAVGGNSGTAAEEAKPAARSKPKARAKAAVEPVEAAAAPDVKAEPAAPAKRVRKAKAVKEPE